MQQVINNEFTFHDSAEDYMDNANFTFDGSAAFERDFDECEDFEFVFDDGAQNSTDAYVASDGSSFATLYDWVLHSLQ